jgi:hypothetical protein
VQRLTHIHFVYSVFTLNCSHASFNQRQENRSHGHEKELPGSCSSNLLKMIEI